MGAASQTGRVRLDWRVAAASGGVALVVAAGAVWTGQQADATGTSAGVRRPVARVTDPTSTPTVTATPTPTATTTATPSPTPTDVGNKPLLPNLHSLKASDVHIVTREGVRRLRFSSTLADVGFGPLEIVPRPRNHCPKGKRDVFQAVYQDKNGDHRYQRTEEHRRVFRQSGCMEFHPAHNHWHVDASARYWLTRPGETTSVVRHSKVSFCLRDSHRLAGSKRVAIYGFCTRDKRQGITPGWGDVYQSFLPGQSLKLPRSLPKGLYCLRQLADPLNVFTESDEADNASVRPIRINGNRVKYVTTTRCRTPRPTTP